MAKKINYYQHTSINFKNYIYLKYYNYLKYSSIAPEAYFKRFEKEKLSKELFYSKTLSNTDKKKLETNLNLFFPHNNGGGHLRSELSQKTFDTISGTINKYLEKEHPEWEVADWDKLTIRKKEEQSAQNLNTKITKIQNYTMHNIKTWDDQIQRLAENLNKLTIEQMENANGLKNKLDSLVQQWENIVKSNPNKKSNGGRSGRVADNTKEFQKFKQNFNNLYNEMMGYGDKEKSIITGDIFEIFVAAATYGMATEKDKAMRDIDSWIEDALVGGKNKAAKRAYDRKVYQNLSHKQYEEIAGKKLKNYDGDLISVFMPQGKSDVKFILKGKEVNATIKNYNLQANKEIKLVSNSPLWDMVYKDSEFVSHYLNVLSRHGYYSQEVKYEPSFFTRTMAHNIMRKLIFARSLAGGGTYELRRDLTKGYSPQADIFIINDSNQGKIKVLYINEIINDVFKDISLMSIANKITKKRQNGSTYELQGYPDNDIFQYSIDGWERWPWYPPLGDYGRKRRTQLYRQMHQIKIQTSVSINLFKKYFGYN